MATQCNSAPVLLRGRRVSVAAAGPARFTLGHAGSDTLLLIDWPALRLPSKPCPPPWSSTAIFALLCTAASSFSNTESAHPYRGQCCLLAELCGDVQDALFGSSHHPLHLSSHCGMQASAVVVQAGQARSRHRFHRTSPLGDSHGTQTAETSVRVVI